MSSRRAVLILALMLFTAPLSAQNVSADFNVVCVADARKTREFLAALDRRQAEALAAAAAQPVAPAASPTDSSALSSEAVKRRVAVPPLEPLCTTETPTLHFGSEVGLIVQHAPGIDFGDAGEPDPQELVLFLDGKPLPGTYAQVGPSREDDYEVATTLLRYRVTRSFSTPEARAQWNELLRTATDRSLALSTGLPRGPAVPTHVVANFQPVEARALMWSLLALVALVVVFFLVATRTGALRDKEPGPSNLDPTRRAYSLSRTQAALWTAVVVFAYVFIWIVTGEYNATIPASVVMLMGISAATFGAAAAIDASKAATAGEQLAKHVAAQKQAEEENSGDGEQASDSDDDETEPQPERAVAVGAGGAAAARKRAPATRGRPRPIPDDEQIRLLRAQSQVVTTESLPKDLFTSADGTGLHRLQFGVWTVALVVVFLFTVWRTLAMPDFDSTLLALMGVTSGVYAGLKIPEVKSRD